MKTERQLFAGRIHLSSAHARFLAPLLVVVACSARHGQPLRAESAPPHVHSTIVASQAANSIGADNPAVYSAEVQPAPGLTGSQLDGHGFPDGVLALTWDDGPDRHSVELAQYLKRQRISATFFVVQKWSREVSSYPGIGPSVQNTGYARIPILQALVRLGHRVANHTEHHVFLDRVNADDARQELLVAQRALAPFEHDELGLFRAPGGAWSQAIADEANASAELHGLSGPVRWDVDRKDWESSILCDSVRPGVECEWARARKRLKPAVTAAHYLESISNQRHGIVLLHDRVADVGSRYALDVAQILVPALIERGFVFASPVLAFSPLSERLTPRAQAILAAEDSNAWRFYDEDRDGRADLCVNRVSGWVCLRSAETRKLRADGSPKIMFEDVLGSHRLPAETEPRVAECSRRLGGVARPGDLDADGRDECCALSADGVVCAPLSSAAPSPPKVWSTNSIFRAAFASHRPLLLGDLNGDGRADVCAVNAEAIECAFSTGSSFTRPTVWARLEPRLLGGGLALADVNGDSRADLCVVQERFVSCGLAP